MDRKPCRSVSGTAKSLQHKGGGSLLEMHQPNVAELQRLARVKRRAVSRQARRGARQFELLRGNDLAPGLEIENCDALLFEEHDVPAVGEPLWRTPLFDELFRSTRQRRVDADPAIVEGADDLLSIG